MFFPVVLSLSGLVVGVVLPQPSNSFGYFVDGFVVVVGLWQYGCDIKSTQSCQVLLSIPNLSSIIFCLLRFGVGPQKSLNLLIHVELLPILLIAKLCFTLIFCLVLSSVVFEIELMSEI